MRTDPRKRYVKCPGHRGGNSWGFVREHILIVESVLGKPLPINAVVHHVNGNPNDNRTSNLVVCPGNPYHRLIHARADALEACGNANYMRCPFCKQWDDPGNMSMILRGGRKAWHKKCRNDHLRSRRMALVSAVEEVQLECAH